MKSYVEMGQGRLSLDHLLSTSMPATLTVDCYTPV